MYSTVQDAITDLERRFGPLDEDAMIGIARKQIRQTADLWQQKRDKQLAVSEEVLTALAQRAHTLNEKSKGEEGGRIVRKLISDLIEHRVQIEANTTTRGISAVPGDSGGVGTTR